MSIEKFPPRERVRDLYSHIDMGFLNRRLAITALGPVRNIFLENQKPGDDHMTQLSNDHLLVTMLLDVFSGIGAPTLAEGLTNDDPTVSIMSIERLMPCPAVWEEARVRQQVHFDIETPKPVFVDYHTEHIVSSTGRMTLATGNTKGYREAIVGLLHRNNDHFLIEPIVMGAPWLDHPRNKEGQILMWLGREYGEILPEDIEEFSALSDVVAADADEWMSKMKAVPESQVKNAIAKILKEPTKKDWGGEENDHFSSNITVGGRRRTAAFLLKGPSRFEEMTPAMCGKNGDQIYRLDKANADVSIVQHSHLIGPAVRETIRSFTVAPGNRARKFCIIDGQATFRLLKAYDLLE